MPFDPFCRVFFKVIFKLNKVAAPEKKSHRGAKTFGNFVFPSLSYWPRWEQGHPIHSPTKCIPVSPFNAAEEGNLGPHLETFHKPSTRFPTTGCGRELRTSHSPEDHKNPRAGGSGGVLPSLGGAQNINNPAINIPGSWIHPVSEYGDKCGDVVGELWATHHQNMRVLIEFPRI